LRTVASRSLALSRSRREGEKLKETPEKKRSHRLIAEIRREAGLRIGIIGIGRIGHLLVNCLLRFGDVYPSELYLVGDLILNDMKRLMLTILFLWASM
jgi:hypothetical protein